MTDFTHLALIFSLLALFVTACVPVHKNTPISQFDPGVAELCTEGSHEYQGKPFTLSFDATTHCPPEAAACISTIGDVHVPDQRTCPRHLAHELNHLVGNHWVDRPQPRT